MQTEPRATGENQEQIQMPKVFISYTSRDGNFAELTRLKLQNCGIDVWLDSLELRGGDEWRRAIDEGIDRCNVVLVILTPTSCASSYVTYEWAYALGKGKKIIPLLLETAEIHPRLEVLQYIDFRHGRPAPWTDLSTQIRNTRVPL